MRNQADIRGNLAFKQVIIRHYLISVTRPLMWSPRKTALIATLLFGVPLAIGLICFGLIHFIPGCNPNPYSLGDFRILSVNLSFVLLIGQLSGFGFAFVLGLFVSLPMFVASVNRSM